MKNTFPEVKKNLGFGCMRLPMISDEEVDDQQCMKMADLFLQNGFNGFDTGYVRTYEFKKTVCFLEPGILLWQCADN